LPPSPECGVKKSDAALQRGWEPAAKEHDQKPPPLRPKLKENRYRTIRDFDKSRVTKERDIFALAWTEI
jgi:hypothetical protein